MVSELLLETYLPIVCGKNKSRSGGQRDIIDAYARQEWNPKVFGDGTPTNQQEEWKAPHYIIRKEYNNDKIFYNCFSYVYS